MPNSSTSTTVGWSLSFILYFLILFGGAYALSKQNTKIINYTASKKNLLNVTLVERQEKKVTQNKKIKKVVKKKTTVNKPKPVKEKKIVRAKKTDSKPDLKSLFKNVKIAKVSEKRKQDKRKVRKKIVKEQVEEVIKENKANNITKALEFEQQENLIITQKDGVFDEFRGKISDLLDTNWQETIDTVSGNEAIVIVSIDKLGNFSYIIETLSYNDSFNAKLRDFLEEMKDVEFPPFKDGEVFSMKAVFKDILE